MRSSVLNSQSRPESFAASVQPRRGSALVVVIGTLALISVFAAIYISIGRADTRAVATQESRSEEAGYMNRYAEYTAQIIAMDRFDATMQYADALQRYQVPRREATDSPYTDWSVRSESDDPANWFFPAGGNPYVRENGDNFDPRVPSDPWLASLRPDYLGPLGLPDVTSFSRDGVTDSFALEGYLDKRDWYQISNLAPDGRFVNLFNLRPQEAPGETSIIGGFASEPGWGETNFPDGSNIRRMSEGLSLYRMVDETNAESAIQSFDPTLDGFWLPGLELPKNLGLSVSEIQNTPAVWSMYQRFALIPANQPFVTYNRSATVSSWADPDFPAYQWADADGDGFYDSRWFELTEARSELVGPTPRDDIQRLYDAGDLRVFAGIRVVDLSGMVNVNTARDSLIPPTSEYPLGLTPTEIDLSRLLTMQDQAENYDGDVDIQTRVEPLSYAHLRAPGLEPGVAQNAARRPAADYSRYRHRLLGDVSTGTFTLDPGRPGFNQFPAGVPAPGQPEFPNAMAAGRYAMSAIHESIVRNLTLPTSARGTLSVSSIGIAPHLRLTEGSVFQRLDANGLVIGRQTEGSFNTLAEQRKLYYDHVGSINPIRIDEAGVRSLDVDGLNLTDEGRFYGMGLFGLDDLAELLTYHGLNDPEITTRLESAAQGRLQFEGGTGDERYSPLLSTRPLGLDRDFHGRIALNRFNPNRGTEVTGEISRESLALMALSPRTKMTTVSGSVPFRAASVAGLAGGDGSRLTPSALRADVDLSIPVSDLTNPQSAFDVYYHALAGELEVFRLKRGANGLNDGLPRRILNTALWETDLVDVRDNPYSTLFYGHRGPELALRIAAHAAANASDMFDADNTPTILTLKLDNSSITERVIENVTEAAGFGTTAFRLDRNKEALLYPGLADQAGSSNVATRLLDLDADVVDAAQVLPTEHLPEARRLVNVFGVEPTPIITEVASMYVYTDASSVSAAGGDDDFNSVDPPRRPRPDRDPIVDIKPVTIDGELKADNTDLLMQVLAIQLTNPWDERIDLSGGTGPQGLMWRQGDLVQDRFRDQNNLEFNYYIEFNGRFFKLGEYREYFPPLNNGGIDYATNSDYTSAGGPAAPPGTPIPLDDPAYDELRYKGVTLQPGESRVFYVTGHTRLLDEDLGQPQLAGSFSLDETWENVLWAYDSGRVSYERFTNPGMIGSFDNDADGDSRPDGFDGRGWTGPAAEWLGRAFRQGGSQGAPYRIHPFNPRTGALVDQSQAVVDPADFVDFMSPGDPERVGLAFTDRDPDATVVRLWRKNTVPDLEEQAVPLEGAQIAENLIQNDILVDRLFLGEELAGGGFLDVSMPKTNFKVLNSVGFKEDFVPVSDPCNAPRAENRIRNDNTGITFTRWATVRRLDTSDTLGSGGAVGIDETDGSDNIGKIDSYLLASRRDPDKLIKRRTNKPGAGADTTSVPISRNPDIGQWFTLCDPADPLNPYNGKTSETPTDVVEYDLAESPHRWFERMFPGSYRPVLTIAQHPRLKSNNGAAGTAITNAFDRFEEDRLIPAAGFRDLFNGTDPLLPEVFLGRDLDAPRVTDGLLAMGIGPAYAPDPTRDPTVSYEVVDDEWMTLSEAFAIALGFEEFPEPTAIDPLDASPDIVWHDSVRTYTDPLGGGTMLTEYVLDDLRLRLDDYVAFLNLERGGEIDPDQKPAFTFNPSSPSDADARRGTGVPLALGVLDGLRAIDPPVYPGDDLSEEEGEDLFKLTSPIMGLVNINTAPLDVLRLLPGLSPSAAGYRTRDDEVMFRFNAPKPEWWAAVDGLSDDDMLGVGDAFLAWDGSASPLMLAAQNPDIAAGLAAYRDRVTTQPRGRSDPRFLPIGLPGDFTQLSYANDMSDSNPNREPEAILDNRYSEVDNNTFTTRSAISGVDGLRGTPGFGSLGEMLMASIRKDTGTLPTGPGASLASYTQLSMQRFANDDLNLGVSGTELDAVSLSPNFRGSADTIDEQTRAGNTPDDYVEKLAAAAGVMNMTTTRSDFYAVWMVLQGFRESDVASLRKSDALVPSFKRRFLMVIDRSNVIEPGDAPRIVLMREVPL